MQIAPAGDNAVLVDLGNVSAEELHRAAGAMRAEPGVVAVIPGHSTLYVIRGEPEVRGEIAGRAPRTHHLNVELDGPDLHELLERVDRDELLERIRRLDLRARYLGFRGGFAYLDGWPEEWAMPRRPTSRPLVERGTFGVAGAVAAFYPVDSPGGWNLLGHTDTDLEHAIVPGDRIVIEPVPHIGRPPARKRETRLVSSYADFIAAPLCTRVSSQDLSNLERGLPSGGPFDDVAAAIASAAVSGEVELFECAMAGPHLRFTRPAVMASCTPNLDVHLTDVRAGQEVKLGRIEGGLRAYVAIGEREGTVVRAERGNRLEIGVIAGPHDDYGCSFRECEVTSQLDRVGIRLRPLEGVSAVRGLDLARASLPSCGMQCGTVQQHPDGTLVAMGPDHPVTGGYPQVMTVITTERWKLAQVMPGERVRFRFEAPPQSPYS